jgi:hypothetical protein
MEVVMFHSVEVDVVWHYDLLVDRCVDIVIQASTDNSVSRRFNCMSCLVARHHALRCCCEYLVH